MSNNGAMRVAIIGVGGIGSALATLFAHHGHEVILASRDPETARHLARDIGATAVESYRTAAEACSLLCFCIAWEHAEAAVERLGDLSGTVVLDVTNPEAPDGGNLTLGHTASGAEVLASRAPGAKVVKAFNYVYAELLRDFGALAQLSPSIFLCGDHEDANALVAGLIRHCGLEPVDCGPLRNACHLESLAMLMVQLVRERQWPPAGIAMKLAHAPFGA